MSQPAPEHESLLQHVRDWFEKDVKPDLDRVKADLGRLADFAAANGKTVADIADVVEDVAGIVAPESEPEVVALVGRAQALAEKAEADLEKYLNG